MSQWSDFEHGKPAYEKMVLVGKTTDDGDLDHEEGMDEDNVDNLEVVPATDVNMPLSNDLLDDTDLTVTDARSHILGLMEWNIDLTLNYKPGNIAYDVIQDAFTSRDTIWVVYVPNQEPGVELADTDEGYCGRAVVETFEHSGGVDDLETVDVSLQSASEMPYTAIGDIPAGNTG